jgi:hypothetical protein
MSDDSDKKNIFERFVPVLVILIVFLAFVVGVMWQKIANLEKNSGTNTVQGAQQQGVAPTQPPVSLDKIKEVFAKSVINFGGDKRKVIFIEVADPSCPYCQVAGGRNSELNNQIDPTGRFKLVADGGTYLAPLTEMKKLCFDLFSGTWQWRNGNESSLLCFRYGEVLGSRRKNNEQCWLHFNE